MVKYFDSVEILCSFTIFSWATDMKNDRFLDESKHFQIPRHCCCCCWSFEAANDRYKRPTVVTNCVWLWLWHEQRTNGAKPSTEGGIDRNSDFLSRFLLSRQSRSSSFKAACTHACCKRPRQQQFSNINNKMKMKQTLFLHYFVIWKKNQFDICEFQLANKLKNFDFQTKNKSKLQVQS